MLSGLMDKQKGKARFRLCPVCPFYLRDCGALVVFTRAGAPSVGGANQGRAAALQMIDCPRSPFCLSDRGSYAFGGNR